MRQVYDALVAAGEPLGLTHVGSATLNALRMEKAYKSGHELTNEVTLAEADLKRFSREEGFQGSAVSLEEPEKWVLAYLRLEEPGREESQPADPLGSESVWKDGRCVGSIASGGFGYAVGAWLGWAYVAPGVSGAGTELEVLNLGKPRRAVVLGEPAFDPGNERARA